MLPGCSQVGKCLKQCICEGNEGISTKGTLDSIYRCNNVLYIRGVEEEEEDGEMRE